MGSEGKSNDHVHSWTQCKKKWIHQLLALDVGPYYLEFSLNYIHHDHMCINNDTPFILSFVAETNSRFCILFSRTQQ